jgi:alkylhydroperoxidase family enzyme
MWQQTAFVRLTQANREAPTLAFSKPRGGAAKATTTAALTAQHLPETDMEAEVAAMLQAAGMHSGKAVEEAEDALALKVGACVCQPALRHDSTTHANECSYCVSCHFIQMSHR